MPHNPLVPTVLILIGAPGLGKSTYAEKVHSSAHDDDFVTVCSADDAFIDNNGEYRFDPSKLADAHADCLKHFLLALADAQKDVNRRLTSYTIVVDNTNTTALEIAPYYAAARAYRAKIALVNFAGLTTADACVARNTHEVPEAVVRAAHARTCSIFTELPPYWECEKLMISGVV